MFELGLRLAFDKPTVIIKDDKTDYSFDTGVIEHLTYPRDLRFTKIVEFKKKLAEKVANTYKASIEDAKHSPFLKSFGEFHVASLAQTEAPAEKVMLEMLLDMQKDMQVVKRSLDRGRTIQPRPITEKSSNELIRSETEELLTAAAISVLVSNRVPLNVPVSTDLSAAIAKRAAALGYPVSRLTAAELEAALESAKSVLNGANS